MVCRYAVWVLGSSTTLCAHSNLWRDLIHHAKESNSFFDAAHDEGMHKIIDKFRRHRKPVFHKNDDINWHRDYKRIRCSESPRWSIWDSTETATVCSNFEIEDLEVNSAILTALMCHDDFTSNSSMVFSPLLSYT